MRETPGHRSAGVLLHPTCLPSPFGVGDLGPAARSYLEWLAEAGVGWWQVLPVHPPGPGQSPYSAESTFAGNPLLISPELLVEDGLLGAEELVAEHDFVDFRVDYRQAWAFKHALLRVAFDRVRQSPPSGFEDAFNAYVAEHSPWLDDYSCYAALKSSFRGAAWSEWPEDLARHRQAALDRWSSDHRSEIDFVIFCQYLFHRQWTSLHRHAAQLGVRILGDLPIFVALDSAEVWAHPEYFQLDAERRPWVVAGVPPDYFSATGQLWGNPLYDWERLAAEGYAWWIDRVRHALCWYDALRLDHFRGFAADWEVPAADPDASGGRWVPGPGRELFDALAGALGGLPFVAEDLGEITPDVIELRRSLGLPGMAILHFAFDTNPRSTFIPYSLERDLVVYTGTHDNNTTVGWYLEDATEDQRALVRCYAGGDGREIHWDLIRLALASVCDMAIIPHQDLAGLGGDCRMNRPGMALGNWEFRMTEWMLEEAIQSRLAELVACYGRALPAT